MATEFDQTHTTAYLLGSINANLAEIFKVLGSINDKLNNQDKRMAAVEERVRTVEHRVDTAEDWQQSHDRLESETASKRQQALKRILDRKYNRWDMGVVAGTGAILTELLNHLNDAWVFLMAHIR